MKRILFLLFFVVVFAACQKESASLIIGKWELVTKWSSREMSEPQTYTRVETFDSGHFTWLFEENGSFYRIIGESADAGYYSLQGNKLIYGIKNSKSEFEDTIVELTNNKLVVTGEDLDFEDLNYYQKYQKFPPLYIKFEFKKVQE